MSLTRRIRDALFPTSARVAEQTKLLRKELKRLAMNQEKLQKLTKSLVDDHARLRHEVASHQASLRHEIARAGKHDRRIEEGLEKATKLREKDTKRVGWELKGIKYWSQVFELQVQAILRRLYMEAEEIPYPFRLMAQRFRLTSQNQEDGITWAVLSEVGFGPRRFVEIGCGMNGGNSGFLASELGWTGLMVDADDYKVERLVRQFGQAVAGAATWVTRENINELIKEHGLTGEIDVFSLDIDGPDYWIWEALEACSPRLVIIEYNVLMGAERSVVVPYDANFDRHEHPEHGEWGRYYFGASLQALIALGRRKGYRLVAAEPEGANAYFLRSDLGPHIPEARAEQAFHVGHRYNMHVQKVGETLYDFVARAELPLLEVR